MKEHKERPSGFSPEGRFCLQKGSDVDVFAHAFRQGRLGKTGEDLGYSIVKTVDDLAIGLEFRIEYRI